MKKTSTSFHIWFWVVYTIVYTILGASYKNDFTEAFIFELLNLPMRLVIAYLNYFIFLPLLLHQNKIGRYVLYTLISLIVAGSCQRVINYEALNILYPDMQDFGLWLPYKFLQAVFLIGTPMIILIAIVSVSKMADLQRKTKTLENEKLQSELKYLKSQTNPHFLFNTLNNIYGLSLENSKKVPELILKLSDFLSFSLYESDKKFIPIEKEISLINDLVELEKSRFEDRVVLNISLPKDTNNILVPPLILVPFVENAFKHSLSNEIYKAKIDISLKTENDYLEFTIRNTRPEENAQASSNNGLGLKNIKKRLAIIYNKDYTLDIQNKKAYFRVQLNIRTK